MKRLPYILLAALLCLAACDPSIIDQNDPTDPQFTVTGLPGGEVNAYAVFTLSVSSKSDGAITFKSSNTQVATITIAARREYKVTAKCPATPTQVTISFDQEAKGIYPETVYELTFYVLPETTDSGTTAPEEEHADLDGVKVSFKENTALIVNPERGFYRARDYFTDSEPIRVSEIKAQRLEGYALWYLGFYLTDFMDGDISQAFLDKIQTSMDALREGGAKCILRFAYRDNDDQFGKLDQEPELSIVLKHIDQLKPLLKKNEDVICVLQAGFVGSWGEWYYTTHFVYQPRTDADYVPRRQLTDALLEALPASRQIQLRTPQFKMRMYGLSLKDTLTAANAHNGSALSRLAGHNDCFGASEDDYGTFDNEPNDRKFWKADTRYTFMGGETCGVSDFCVCEASLQDMRDYHWSYLNQDYHHGVLNRWKSDNCYNQIVARLGYRFVMKDLFYSKNFAAGKNCDVTLRFYNTGFAAPMNPRKAVLVWEGSDGKSKEFPINSDPRTWHSGWHVISAAFTPTTAKGTLYLALRDPLLPERPEYSIALANEGVFDSGTGLNKLFEIK